MRKPGRHRPSSVDRLDPEIKRLISDLRIDQGWTIDEIRAKLVELGESISRSALGRHIQSIEEIGAELRQVREMAAALAEQTGGDPGRVADLNVELLHTVVLRIVTATKAGEMVNLDPKEVMFLASTLSNLATARKTDADWRAKIEKAAIDKAKRAAADEVKRIGKQAGLTKEAVDQVYQAVLGVAV